MKTSKNIDLQLAQMLAEISRSTLLRETRLGYRVAITDWRKVA